MSAKLIVQRFDHESSYQTLNILLENNDDIKEAKFSNWQEGADDPQKKDRAKPRLIVKVVSEENTSPLDLDSCAQKVDKLGNFLDNIILRNPFETKQHSAGDIKNVQLIENCNQDLETSESTSIMDQQKEKFLKYFLSLKSDVTNRKNDSSMNILEYSLERVKENNARIMENINILNRTLIYTKKRDHNPKILRSYPCDECGKCFVYENGLRRHYAVRHVSLDPQPRWQVVWTCAECFQVWPQRSLAEQHAKQSCNNDNPDSVQEIKTSSLLQCEFCEKVFTSIPRLLSHLKLHTVSNNYECKACDIAFSCYKTAEQHWMVCMWLKMYYQFSLPKLLLCNACDRKFRNYDQLYNHRYKVGHFIPKASNENNAFVPLLVYQCEICGQWFNAIFQLQEHRNKYHPHSDIAIQHNIDIQPREVNKQ